MKIYKKVVVTTILNNSCSLSSGNTYITNTKHYLFGIKVWEDVCEIYTVRE